MIATLWVCQLVSCKCITAVKWHTHIFKWHSAAWRPRVPTADCDWSVIGPPTQIFFVTDEQKQDYLSRDLQCARGVTKRHELLAPDPLLGLRP